MLLVVDANVLIAALIKDSDTRELLMSDELTLIAPEFLLEEATKYIGYISQKTKLEKEIVEELLTDVIQRAEIKIYPTEEFKEEMKPAFKLSPDPNDTMYFALALKTNAAIWSNDKALKKQGKVKIISTKELQGEK